MHFAKTQWIAALLAIAVFQVAPAKAETFNTCAGFIEALPAVITTQGVWCLKKDLATSMTSGSAITIATNNVTIDCNGFKIGGLAAGTGSTAFGIRADSRLNSTVRHCNVRGFKYGVWLDGAGHLVEDSRLDQSLHIGIYVWGDNNRVQRNAVYDTGGSPGFDVNYGIYSAADVIDNTVAGVFASTTDTTLFGVFAWGSGNEIRGNRVRDLAVPGTGSATGIRAVSSGMTVTDNRISAEVMTAGNGIDGGTNNNFCTGNTVVNFATAYVGCGASDGNLSLPAGP